MDESANCAGRTRRPCRRAGAPFLAAALAIVLGSVVGGEATQRRAGSVRVVPAALPISAPEAQGMDSEVLARAVESLVEQRHLYDIHSLTVIRHGHTVADVSFYPYRPGSLHNLASVSKVFLTTLIGIAIDRGLIESVDQRVIDFFPDRCIANLDARKRALTIEHLLTMTSGLGSSDAVDTHLMEQSADWVQYALDLPMTNAPGTRWRYHQPSAFLLSAILTRTTGMSALDFAREQLFEPLGVSSSHWTASPEGLSYGFHELKLRPSDVASFGQLVLQGGRWHGQQLVPEAWLEDATTAKVGGFYGYMWYRRAELPGCAVAGGARGQRLVVAPSQDLVIVMTGGGPAEEDIEQVVLETVGSYLLPAVRSDDPLPENPEGVAALVAATRRAASVDREQGAVAPPPALASTIAGRTFAVRANVAGIESLTLSFPTTDEARLRFTTDGVATYDRDFEWAAGLAGIERCTRGMLEVLECGTGQWRDGRTFEMEVDMLGLLGRFRLSFEFAGGGDRFTVTVEDLDWWEPNPPFFLIAARQD